MHDRYFTDEELVAYLDGETDFAPVAEITAVLAQDPALQARLAALEIDRAALAEGFADLQPEAGLRSVAVLSPGARHGGWSGQIAVPAPQGRAGLRSGIWGGAVAAALVVGVFLGAALSPSRDGWAEYVAAYQALYSNSTLAHIDVPTPLQQAELDRVAASIGKSMSVEHLQIFPDVRFARSQILSFEGQPLIQLAFLTSTGDPLALCIMRAEEGAERAPELRRMEGLSAALWQQGGYRYILIGGEDDALIGRMSTSLAAMNV